MRLKTFCLAAVLAAGSVFPASAHHSHAMYESTKRVIITGTVKDWQWANPHVWLYVLVSNPNGQQVEWVLEGGGVNGMTQRGWRADSFKPGDKISVRFRPLKDGSSGGVLGTVTHADGRTFNHPD